MAMDQGIFNLIIGFSIITGVIQCFFGYRLFKIILALTGFLVGGALGASIGFAISQETAVALLAGIVGGFIGAALLVALYYVGVFLIGVFLGGILGMVLYAMVNSEPQPAVVLILAIIAGVVALIFQRVMIILSTGFGGSWSIVTGIAYFTTGSINPVNIESITRASGSLLFTIILCWLALGIIGVIVQFKTTSGKAAEPSAIVVNK